MEAKAMSIYHEVLFLSQSSLALISKYKHWTDSVEGREDKACPLADTLRRMQLACLYQHSLALGFKLFQLMARSELRNLVPLLKLFEQNLL